MPSPTTDERTIHPANRLGLDYAAEAERLGSPPVPIIDVHSHISGEEATRLYRRSTELYGVEMTYTMSPLTEVDRLRALMDGRIRFIAVPNYWETDPEKKAWQMTDGYAEQVVRYHEKGARIVKFWVAPRSIDYAKEMGIPGALRLDSPSKVKVMEVASDLGMYFMAHIADPDTWFETKYADASVYGTKRQQYEPVEELVERFTQPWILAHMGGWPEDLEFLTGLLERHDNLHLDTSACKWMVRELSRHSRDDLIAFLRRFRGRVLFGTDIVTSDDHLRPVEGATEIQAKASTAREAFDLYASRHWALRHLWETDYDDESPIADPDLALVDPDSFTKFDAPRLSGRSIPEDLLRSLYHDAAHDLLEPLHG